MLYRLEELIGKNVIFQGVERRMTGRVRIPAKDHDFLVVTPVGSNQSDLVHMSDVISIVA